MKKLFLISVLLLIWQAGFAQSTTEQETKIDSLKQLISTAKHDTIIIKAWKIWDNMIYVSNPELDFELNQNVEALCNKNLEKKLSKKEKKFFQEAKGWVLNNLGLIYSKKGNYAKAVECYTKSLKIKEEIGDKQGIASSLNNFGLNYSRQGKYAKAVECYTKSLKIKEEIGDKQGIANSINNIGLIYSKQGDYAKSIEYYTKSLKIQEEIGNKQGIANSLDNIGIIYFTLEDFVKAIKYYTQSLKIREEIEDKRGIAISVNNIGLVYSEQKDYAKSIEYYTKSLKIQEQIGNKEGIANSLNNIGIDYFAQGDYVNSLEYNTQSLKIREEIGYKEGIASSLNSLGAIYYEQGNYASAINYNQRSLSVAQEIGKAIETKDAAELLWKSYKQLGQHKDALKMYELYISTKDSMNSDENQRKVIRQGFQYNYEKQSLADSLAFVQEQQVNEVSHRAELDKEASQRYVLYGGLGFLFLIGGISFRGYQRKKKDNALITEQKAEVEKQKVVVEKAHDVLGEKNQEIMDSINYAKRIQSAILPSAKLVNEYLQESFILFKPKDIVAGDFYWIEPFESTLEKGKRGMLFAAADCTGHGVPGAMVSVICTNGLNRSVREYGLTDPAQILDKAREIVISEFEKSEEEVKDGMDIALCSLEDTTLKYAGANNPLWIIPKAAKEIEDIIEYKADKQPIGKYAIEKPFTTHTIELNKGDSIYIFSDGFVDQFGGAKGKKFKANAFRALLVSIQNNSMQEQKAIIDNAFETWRGSLEQVDDVCVIGIKIE
ncbi:MAG: hypothetical protein COA99_12410 [Moraxellaceae bacterium]|nr:MAG: hypothetical protein COA99_12410 [Moraxellaceae bacterium]